MNFCCNRSHYQNPSSGPASTLQLLHSSSSSPQYYRPCAGIRLVLFLISKLSVRFYVAASLLIVIIAAVLSALCWNSIGAVLNFEIISPKEKASILQAFQKRRSLPPNLVDAHRTIRQLSTISHFYFVFPFPAFLFLMPFSP